MSIYKVNNLIWQSQEFKLSLNQFNVQAGQIYAIIGPNGAGKTMLLNLLSFVMPPDSGDIYFNNQKVDYSLKKNLIYNRRSIGYLMQNPYLFNISVEDNISYGLKIRDMAKEIIEEKITKLCDYLGLSELRRINIHQLSGGQKQKVALARTLVLDTQVLLLDEPTAYLDKKSIDLVEDIIKKINQDSGKTIIVTTHSQEQAYRLTQKTILMVDGKTSAFAL